MGEKGWKKGSLWGLFRGCEYQCARCDSELPNLLQNLIKAMIEKSRVYPQFQYSPQRYQIDYFHNPYLAKLNLKLTPRPNIKPNQLLSPLSLQNNLYLSQAIPLYKDERTKVALVWKQYITHKYARAHFGASVEYKLYESLRVKTKAMVGTTSLLDLEIAKQLPASFEGFLGYSGLLQNNSLFSSINTGIRRGAYSAHLSHKINDQTQLTLCGQKQLLENLTLQSSYNCNLSGLSRGELQLSLHQQIDAKSSTSLGVVGTPYYKQLSLKVQYERLLTKTEKVVISTQYSQGRSVFYLGFKNFNFNFVFPFFAVDQSAPFIIGALAYGLTYLYKRYTARKNKSKPNNVVQIDDIVKSEENRREELQLIGEKAADFYEKEKLSRRGLLIEQAYIGPTAQIEQFMNNPQRFLLIIRNEEYKEKFVDLTVTLRFYVMKGELKLRRGQKNCLLGFYHKRHENNRIGIRYIKNGQLRTAYFDEMDPIVIGNQE